MSFRQINTLKKEIRETRRLREVLVSEKQYNKEELDLVVKDYERNQELNEYGVISDYDRELKEGEWLRMQKQYSSLDKGIIQNLIGEQQLALEVERLKEDRSGKVYAHQSLIAEQTIN